MNCATVDELAGAFALGALPTDEAAAIEEHLRICPEEHADIRRFAEVAAVLPYALDPVAPSPALRARLMATLLAEEQQVPSSAVPDRTSQRDSVTANSRSDVGATTARGSPQPRDRVGAAGRVAPAPIGSVGTAGGRLAAPDSIEPVRRLLAGLGKRPARVVAAVAVAVAIAAASWSVALQTRLAEVERAVGAVAAADALHRVNGTVGLGWLAVTDDHATFVATHLTPPPPGHLYELWLIDAAGTPSPVGIIDRVSDVTVVPLEGSIRTAVVFAVTIELQRVDRPSGEPVLTARLGTDATP